jgi:hypothetical protein
MRYLRENKSYFINGAKQDHYELYLFACVREIFRFIQSWEEGIAEIENRFSRIAGLETA